MKFLYILLALVPVAIAMDIWGIGDHTTMFVVSALALVPLAAVLGHATEAVAVFTGPKIGGLLNATFGNAAELIITRRPRKPWDWSSPNRSRGRRPR